MSEPDKHSNQATVAKAVDPAKLKRQEAVREKQFVQLEVLLEDLKKDPNFMFDDDQIFQGMIAGFDKLDPAMQQELTQLAKEVDAEYIEELGAKISGPGRFALEVDATGSAIYLSLTPPLGDGKLVTAAEIIKSLADEGNRAPIDQAAIDQAVKQVAETGEPVTKVLVAVGVTPVNGKDGHIDYKVQPYMIDGQEVAREEGTAAADVQENELLAIIIPPTAGQAGKDIFGEEIPAREGMAHTLTAGENVRCDAATSEYFATQPGRVVVDRGVLRVDLTLKIDGDVSLETGDIDFPGTVVILGAVRDGRSVRAGQGVEIFGAVEAAKIEAVTGSINIHQGVQGQHRGMIIAGGDVTAKFVESAVIFAEGSVIVQISIISSEVTAGNEVCVLRGRGALIGGVIRAGQAVKAKEIGSVTDTPTELILGVDPASLKKLIVFDNDRLQFEAKIKEIGKALEQITYVVGDMSKMPFEKKQFIIKLRKAQLIYQYRLKQLIAAKEKYLDELQLQTAGQVEVHGTLYPGVRISMGNYWLNVENRQRYIRLYYDTLQERIVSGPLK